MQICTWEGCDPGIALAIKVFIRACSATPANVRWRAIPTLIRNHLDVALDAVLIAAGFPDVVKVTSLGSDGLAECLSRPHVLDRGLCHLNRLTHGSFAASIDSLRETFGWIETQRPLRTVPTEARRLKGEVRRTVKAVWYCAWPYCVLCGKLSERAQFIKDRGLPSRLEVPGLSTRLCLNHKQAKGGSQRSVRRRAALFEEVLRALKSELAKDRLFRSRFVERAWEVDGSSPLSTAASLQIAMNPEATLIIDPVKTYLRDCAYRISRELPDPTAIEIARLLHAGLNQSQVARHLGMSRQAVSKHVRKTRGCYDFTRTSPLLYWWPDSSLAPV